MTSSQFSSWLEAVCREPYRLFFPLGVVMSIFGVSPWFLYVWGGMKSYPGLFHSAFQVMIYLTAFITGFLLTALPRLLGTNHATKLEVGTFLFWIVGAAVFLSFHWVIAAEIFFLFWLGGLIVFGLRRLLQKEKAQESLSPPKEFIWIPVAVGHGIIGTALLLMGQTYVLPAWALLVGKPMMEQGFLLSVVLGIGGFLIPRLMGHQGPPSSEEGEGVCHTKERAGHVFKKVAVFLHAAGGVLLFCSYWIEGGLGTVAVGRWIRAVVIAVVFLQSKALGFPKMKPLNVRMLWLSVWMVVVGYWGAALFTNHYMVMEHIAFIGGFGLMTYCVGTVVVLNHAGQPEQLRSSLGILWVVGIGLMLSLVKRIIGIYWPQSYYSFLGMSALLWVGVALCWLGFIWPRLFKFPTKEENERLHDEVKKKFTRD